MQPQVWGAQAVAQPEGAGGCMHHIAKFARLAGQGFELRENAKRDLPLHQRILLLAELRVIAGARAV